MFELMENDSIGAVIKVIGVGGGGGNTVQQMVDANIDGVEFICANTDMQALEKTNCKNVIRIGQNVTKGLGAGANPEVGRQAALEDTERLKESLQDTDMVFITAGMGGGTGTGAAPVIAQIAKEMGILTVAVVTKPFPFEGKRRMDVANKGIQDLEQHVDSLITIPNGKLLTHFGRDVTLLNAFKAANDVLQGAVQGIAELITCPGLVNVDFADVRTVMSEMGMAMMGSGSGKGDDRAAAATELAMNSPLLEDIDMHGANGVLVNITAGMDLTIGEYDEIGDLIKEYASDEATVVVGTSIDMEMKDEIRVTVVATGLNRSAKKKQFKSVEIVREATNNQVDQPLRASRDEGLNEKDSGRAVINQLRSDDKTQEADDYLDIPTFLRNQLD
ncbi:cell division protein FtsZ [Marinicella pacifica]|jgi:cell division protein FtsZ|uniref:Cell division protein FtsZ n=1 Tax=Marinicella pacifica TaxID=1171543 RepID=A0A917CX03_9GAMM|nr:cell division protein FtsZ [Marinicella pacifica]GGG00400.1 cell division protein FtsZ [Marinicella pacifica]